MSDKKEAPLNTIEDTIMSRQNECFKVSVNDVYCNPRKKPRTGMDLTQLAPLMLQFLAWNELCIVKKELSEAEKGLTPEKRDALIEAQEKFRKTAVETRHINPITPNYSLKPIASTEPRRQRGGSSHSSDSRSRNRGRVRGHGAVSPVPTPPPIVKRPFVSEYVPGSDKPFQNTVPQNSNFAQLVGFESHTVMLLLQTRINIIGRRTTQSKPDLDLSPIVLSPMKVSHSHVGIEWDAERSCFYARIISANGAIIDGKLYKRGTVEISNGSVIRVQNFEMTLFLPKDMITPQ